MKNPIRCDEQAIERLKRAQSRSEYRRIQCVLIRTTLGSTAAEIVQLLEPFSPS